MLIVASLVLIVVTVLPLARCEVWWVRGWDFPRLQIAIGAVSVCLYAAFRIEAAVSLEAAALASGAACFLYQVSRILPYTPLFRCEVKRAGVVKDSRRLRLLSSNVLVSNRDTNRLIGCIREERPDVFVTLESDARWEKALDELADEYPHTIKRPLDNAYGMHVYSRLPLEDVRVEYLVEPDVPSMHATVVLRSGERVRLHVLHPAPPSPTENETSEERDAELVMVAKHIAAHESGPVVVTGDLNDVAWSTTTRLFRKLSRLLDPRIGRGMLNTFHARWIFARWPLDHFFHSEHFTLVELRRLPAIGSDHFPILIELALESERGTASETPRPDSEDERLARRKLENVGEAS
ncbi:endonuclease/exonuclease/phosphatase family protein [Congregicoccus parvus]|uniref:endonuclease/exonuclease/phosphatase family protein n=1 Tax=Congregicoccus parvus TaxID=3081749 RepID=UPI003FA56B3F